MSIDPSDFRGQFFIFCTTDEFSITDIDVFGKPFIEACSKYPGKFAELRYFLKLILIRNACASKSIEVQ